MNIGILKIINEKLPDSIKIVLGPIIRFSLIKNPVFKRQIDELNKADMWDAKKVAISQLEHLKSILQFAYENSKYYKEIFDLVDFNPYSLVDFNDIKKIPILTREILEKRYDDLIVPNVTNYYQVTTGGTAGKPIKLLLEKDSIFKERAFVYHFWAKAGYDYKHSRLATFRGVKFNNEISKYNPLYNEMMFNPFILNDNNVKEYVKKIDSFGATFLYGYPSAISNFCRLLSKNNLTLNRKIEAVFLISENIYENQVKIIEDTIKCKIYSFYGHTERAVFAEQKENGYSFNPVYGVVELSNENNGKVICTGFLNRKMPLIRYELDDYAHLIEGGIYNIHGHHDQDVLIGKNDERIAIAAINFHCDTLKNIAAYQFVQKEKGKLNFNVQADSKLSDAELNDIKEALTLKVGNTFDCKIMQVDEMELTKRGKFKMIIQELEI
ncbi:phenylacetate--CoA ligase family protein [Aminipila terrae]|uniref:Phenylacetate--CoA ligase family protein n=1 Tax=Aminipila terrae TaxID=2697030 RepID=A0A6P1MH08_9FIRM|nr:phenylacetate--CoA ligase family protein [Aminipila terrae]QHI71298.1 hypothetical protein Ami3637_01805 [Aminipila terrae]